MPQQYKKSGGNAWNNKYKTSDKHPKFTGDIFIDPDVLKDMVIYAKNNTSPDDPENVNKAKVKVALWERMTKKNDPYIYISLEAVPTEVDNMKVDPPSSEEPIIDDEIPF